MEKLYDEVAEQKVVTLDDLMRLPADARVEIVDGEIVEMAAVGLLHHFVGGNVHRLLDGHVFANDVGAVFFDGLIYLLHQKRTHLRGARVPDISFVRKGNIPSGWDITKPHPGAPDLAIEIMSPDDSAEEVAKRVNDYLRAGTEQVWVVYADLKVVYQYRHDAPNTISIFQADQVIDCEPLIPALKLKVADFFILPTWVEMQQTKKA